MQNYTKEATYAKSKKRWHKAEASMHGIMDGFEYVNDIDVADSCLLLEKLIIENQINLGNVIDCAAGIGRVSKHVLSGYFQEIDILEQDEKFVNYCRAEFAQNPAVKNIYCDSLQNFKFENSYDAIWIQWCLQDLLEDDVEKFLKNCQDNLRENGVIIIKENIAHENLSDLDNGYTVRTVDYFYKVFLQQNLQVIHQQFTANWPQELLPVVSFVVQKM